MTEKMKKSLILHVVIGFFAGMAVGVLIPTFSVLFGDRDFSGFMTYAPLAKAVGRAGAIALQLVVSGILGAVSFGGMLLYEIERWSLALATFVHFLSIMAVFTAASFGLGWFSDSLASYFIAVSCEAVAFAIIWLIMYLRWKKTVKEMNEELKEYQKKDEEQ